MAGSCVLILLRSGYSQPQNSGTELKTLPTAQCYKCVDEQQYDDQPGQQDGRSFGHYLIHGSPKQAF